MNESGKLGTRGLMQRRKGDLPVSGLRNGAQAFITDGRKSGEGAGNGTGVLCWYDEASGAWIDPRTTAEVEV